MNLSLAWGNETCIEKSEWRMSIQIILYCSHQPAKLDPRLATFSFLLTEFPYGKILRSFEILLFFLSWKICSNKPVRGWTYKKYKDSTLHNYTDRWKLNSCTFVICDCTTFVFSVSRKSKMFCTFILLSFRSYFYLNEQNESNQQVFKWR